MMTARAHAKINLNLRIVGVRPDGYHDLRTVFQVLALHDTLHFIERPGPFAIESNDPRLPLDESNLVWRAAATLWEHLGRPGAPCDVLVQIDKRIPMKGGLGGGSADAAVTLLTLSAMWLGAAEELAFMPAKDMLALGRRLGADVPFFFTGGAALGEGRGDELRPLPDLPPLGVLLVVPSFDVSTAEAYRWVDEARSDIRASGRPGVQEPMGFSGVQRIPHCPWPSPLDEIANDFEDVVAVRHPDLRSVIRAVGEAGAAAAAMTGSGSTVFGVFEDEQRMAAAVSQLGRFGDVLTTRTLARAEYLDSSIARG